ncbi:MAG: PHP domain-containing protein [Promethearchaeota archaeon]|nr:MAG: PHP domain-containing protein [Candidatus Lokiarchaeota archaeon]
MIDLHLHSNNSDGLDSPQDLVDKAIKKNLKAIALTDHDNIDGIKEFLSYAEERDIIAIPGIEISIKHEPSREIEDVHIVGLNVNYKNLHLKEGLRKQMEGRLGQKKDICRRLREELGYNIPYKEVKSLVQKNSVGRPHIVEIMIKNNPKKVKGKTKNELFKMISLGGKAYVDRKFELNLEESIELIKTAEGIPILDHPGIYEVSDRTKFVEMCIDAGIEGIEVEYTYSKNRPYVGTEKQDWAMKFLPDFYRRIANRYNLIKSGGSDYHGGKKNIEIGEANVPDSYIKYFL